MGREGDKGRGVSTGVRVRSSLRGILEPYLTSDKREGGGEKGASVIISAVFQNHPGQEAGVKVWGGGGQGRREGRGSGPATVIVFTGNLKAVLNHDLARGLKAGLEPLVLSSM